MKPIMEKLEHLLQLGGIKKDILFLVLSGIAIVCSLLGLSPFPFDMACRERLLEVLNTRKRIF